MLWGDVLGGWTILESVPKAQLGGLCLEREEISSQEVPVPSEPSFSLGGWWQFPAVVPRGSHLYCNLDHSRAKEDCDVKLLARPAGS